MGRKTDCGGCGSVGACHTKNYVTQMVVDWCSCCCGDGDDGMGSSWHHVSGS